MDRTRSLDDAELETLLSPSAGGAPALRAQAAISLIADSGVAAGLVRELKMTHAFALCDEPSTPVRTRRLLTALLRMNPDRVFTLSSGRADAPLSRDALRQLCVRHGNRVGVAAATPERLRVTYARRAIAGGMARDELARTLGVSELRVRRMLAADRRARGGADVADPSTTPASKGAPTAPVIALPGWVTPYRIPAAKKTA